MELRSRDCLRQVMAIQGVIGASLVDYASGLVIDSTGREPSDSHEVTAAGVTNVVNAALGGATFAATAEPGRVDDIVMTAGNGYHLVYFVGARPDALLVLYVWLDRLTGNLAMAQRRVRSLTQEMVTG
jgi:hypothetical protein